MNQKHLSIGAVSLLIVALLVSITLHHYNPGNSPPLSTDPNAVNWEGKQLLQQAFNGTGGIAIPGFDSLVFTANQLNQKVNFYNPDINSCLFLMTLFINDTQYWQSDNVAPGMGFYEIYLSDPLSAGQYDAYLKIECLTQDGQPLNSAIVEFTLTVQ